VSTIDYTVDGLIEKVKRWAAIPEYQPGFGTEDILDFLNEELEGSIVPFMIECDEDFFIRKKVYSIPADESTPIHLTGRISAGKIREIKLARSSTAKLDELINITRADLDNYGYYPRKYNTFELRGQEMYIPHASEYGSGCELWVYYYDRPNRLVDDADVAKITNIVGNVVTVSAVPTGYTTALTYDFIRGTPHFEIYDIEQTASSVVSNDFTFSSLPTDLAIGDYVCQTGFSTVANIPYEIYNLLAMGAAVRILEALESNDGLQFAMSRYARMLNDARNALTPRVRGEHKLIVNNGGFL